jgi:hypothetical protein
MRDIFVQRALQLLEQGNVRLDSNETAMLERELTQLRTVVFTEETAPVLGRQFVPQATDIAASVEQYAYKVFRKVGKAKIGGNDADDAPLVDVVAKEITGKVYPVRDAFKYALNELREAARVGTPLEQMRALTAREVIEQGIDEMIAFGNTAEPGEESNVLTKGLLNNTDVEDGEGGTGSAIVSLTNWTDATDPDVIAGELHSLVTPIVVDSKQSVFPTDIILPTDRYSLISQKKVGVDNDTTILRSFLANNPYIQRVSQWWRLDDLGTNSTGRAVCYRRDPMILQSVIPQEFEMLPPQARNYAFVVNCQARCGGVKVYRPYGMRYGDYAA